MIFFKMKSMERSLFISGFLNHMKCILSQFLSLFYLIFYFLLYTFVINHHIPLRHFIYTLKIVSQI